VRLVCGLLLRTGSGRRRGVQSARRLLVLAIGLPSGLELGQCWDDLIEPQHRCIDGQRWWMRLGRFPYKQIPDISEKFREKHT
jgi:hypothetical protein